MNRSAFETGLRFELSKIADAGLLPTPKTTSSQAQQLGTPRPPQVDRGTHTSNLISQQNIAQQEAKNLPSTLDAYTHDFANPGGAGGISGWMARPFAKRSITNEIQGAKPGEVVKPLTQNQMLDHDSVLNDPALFAHAKSQAALKSQQVAKDSSLTDLPGLADQYKGPNDPLNNALRQHVAHDPDNVSALSNIVGDKSYGAFGVGDGLSGKITPGSFRFNDFVKDKWPALLAGGGLLAALMYALRGNNDDDKQRGGPVINNYMGGGMPMGGQPQFSRMPGYNQ